MTSEIIVALISGLCVAIPSIIATINTNKANREVILYRLDKMEEKVNKHNNVIERTYVLEEKVKENADNISEIKRKLEGK